MDEKPPREIFDQPCYGDLFGSSPTHFGYRNAPKMGVAPNLQSSFQEHDDIHSHDDQRYDFGAAIFRQLSQEQWVYMALIIQNCDSSYLG